MIFGLPKQLPWLLIFLMKTEHPALRNVAHLDRSGSRKCPMGGHISLALHRIIKGASVLEAVSWLNGGMNQCQLIGHYTYNIWSTHIKYGDNKLVYEPMVNQTTIPGSVCLQG
jgi:hypothetical protein